jgi:hypothetical protein
MKFILGALLEIVQALAYKWLLAIVGIIKRLIRLIAQFWKWHKLPHDEKNATNTGCGPIDHPSFHRADPLIYSQQYLLKLGLAVTWDNPDIIVLRNGVAVAESALLPNTEYEIEATIWNNSFEAPVVGMKVDFGFFSFGAGGAILTHIDSAFVNVGVKGGAGHPAHARVKWVTPGAGHFCIQVAFNWDDDLNPGNNVGQNNIDVIAAQSPATSRFLLRNPHRRGDDFRFEVDTYALPAQPGCPPTKDDSGTADQKWDEIRRTHSKAAFPIPPGWTVAIAPDHLFLQPDEAAEIEVSIEPPADFTGQQQFNVNAVSGSGKYAGGVTVIVTKA